jgi:hypothetical protein
VKTATISIHTLADYFALRQSNRFKNTRIAPEPPKMTVLLLEIRKPISFDPVLCFT